LALVSDTLHGIRLEFETSPSLFSPRAVDRGTRAMLGAVEFAAEDRVLDLGCGYGVVGILAARLIGPERVVMSDSSEEAIRLARANAARNGVAGVTLSLSDGFSGLDETGFTLILTNPPYHEDFSVPKEFIEKGFNRLALGGRMVLVTRRRTWYEKKLRAIFGGTTVREIDGYTVLSAERRRRDYARTRKRAR
jgi:16S rRNA (guanine1207-N2)-methyltransferase